MPVYEYKCKVCEERFEIEQSFSDDALTTLEGCQQADSGDHDLRKVFSAVGISFKGEGFYRNDSRSGKNSASGPPNKSSDSSSTSDSGSSSSGDSSSSSSSDSSSSGSSDSSSSSSSSGSTESKTKPSSSSSDSSPSKTAAPSS